MCFYVRIPELSTFNSAVAASLSQDQICRIATCRFWRGSSFDSWISTLYDGSFRFFDGNVNEKIFESVGRSCWIAARLTEQSVSAFTVNAPARLQVTGRAIWEPRAESEEFNEPIALPLWPSLANAQDPTQGVSIRSGVCRSRQKWPEVRRKWAANTSCESSGVSAPSFSRM